jgi:ABC-type transport system involved in multi-copper enzyme maturation permease subunit
MIAPILHQELLLGGRRNRLHYLRWLYAGWLVVVLLFLGMQFLAEEASVVGVRLAARGQAVDRHAGACQVIGSRFATSFVWQQSLILLLAVPIFTAGAIVDEKRQGTLQYLLLSEVEPRHLILGKLLGRLAQVIFWLMAGLPLFALCAGFGGVEPVTLLFLLLGLIGPIFGLASLSLAASVWCKQTRDAVMLVYVLMVAGVALVNIFPNVFSLLDPLWVLEPAWAAAGSIDTTEALKRLGVSALFWGILGVISLVVGGWRMIPVYTRELTQATPNRSRWYSLEREPIDNHPVLWRERNIEGLAPNEFFRRIPQWVGVLFVVLATTMSSLLLLYWSLAPGVSAVDVMQALLQFNVRKVTVSLPNAPAWFLLQGVVVMLLAGLVVGARCAGAIAQERERKTWEALLLTPVSAKQIVLGKLWGVLGSSVPYLLAYAAPAVSLAALAGPLAFTFTLVWLAATFLAMYFIAATGLWSSVQASTPWRALLQTMGVGYLGGLLIYALVSPFIAIAALILILAVAFVDLALKTQFAAILIGNLAIFMQLFWFTSAIGLVLSFYLFARYFVKRAQRWIADRERTRHWGDEPEYRSESRRVSV